MKQLSLEAGGITATLTIRHATAGDALRREILADLSLRNPQPDSADQLVASVFYPRCVACAEGTIHWPGHTRQVIDPESGETHPEPAETLPARDLTPAEFVALPAEIFDAWWEAVLEQTPGWNLPRKPTQEQLENPAPNS